MPVRRRSRRPRFAAVGPVAVLALVGGASVGHADPGEGAVGLWAGVVRLGAAVEWRPRTRYPDTATCDAEGREALDAAWRGLRQVGALELVRLGAAEFVREDPRTLETYLFRFACRPEPAVLTTPRP